jgi:uncharacterized membrane-anchored protein
MLSGEFERKLRQLNRRLRVFCGDGPSRPAGVFYVLGGEYMDVCGVDKGFVPEHSERWADGRIRKGGWRRVLKILIQRRLADRWRAERLFRTHLAYSPFDKVKMFSDPLAKRLQQMRERSAEKILSKTGKVATDVIDVQELMDYREEKKRLKAKGEIL